MVRVGKVRRYAAAVGLSAITWALGAPGVAAADVPESTTAEVQPNVDRLQHFRGIGFGYQAAEVAVRPFASGFAGDRQEPSRRDSALRFRDPFRYQVGDCVLVAVTLGPRRWESERRRLTARVKHDRLNWTEMAVDGSTPSDIARDKQLTPSTLLDQLEGHLTVFDRSAVDMNAAIVLRLPY
ncbi:hypothetical protein ASG84_16795 [Rhodococcus sp. Leaf278]|nr:hypothetical protein ASG84_16795 [Rhodococcus sp. Leaf278]